MSNVSEKTASNVFYLARLNASKLNDQLSSRDGASELLGIDRARLFRIESGLINPYPDEILLMSSAYNSPELKNEYCTGMCPLGCTVPKAMGGDLDRVTLQVLGALQEVEQIKTSLLTVSKDGKVDGSEESTMEMILEKLNMIEQSAEGLKLWCEKNLGMSL